MKPPKSSPTIAPASTSAISHRRRDPEVSESLSLRPTGRSTPASIPIFKPLTFGIRSQDPGLVPLSPGPVFSSQPKMNPEGPASRYFVPIRPPGTWFLQCPPQAARCVSLDPQTLPLDTGRSRARWGGRAPASETHPR
jgi:hypothetical protein